MKHILHLLILISSLSYSQTDVGTINLTVRESWSRDHSFSLSIVPENNSIDSSATLIIKFHKTPDEIINVNSADYLNLKKLILKIKKPDSNGDQCTDGTTFTLDYGISKKVYIKIYCFSFKSDKHISDVINYIDQLSDKINLNSK